MIQVSTHTTCRIVLRTHTMTHFEPPYALLAIGWAKVMRSLHNRRDIWYWIASKVGSWQLKCFVSWGVDFRQTGEFIGQIGINKPGDSSELEVGWIFLAAGKGKGLAHEAGTAVLHWVQNSLKPATLVSYILLQNHWSIALAQHLAAAHNSHAEIPRSKIINQTNVYRQTKGTVPWR